MIRIMGVVVSLDFFLKQREERFLIFTFGWILWVITGVLPILSGLVENKEFADFLILLNSLITPFGTLFIILGIILYIRPISLKVQLTLPLLLLFGQIILILIIGEGLAGQLTLTFFFFLTWGLILLGVIKRREIRKYLARSIIWYYITIGMFVLMTMIIVFNTIRRESFGLYQSNDVMAILVNYTMGIVLTALIIVLFIHTEQSLSSKELQTSEERYRTLYETTRVGLVTSLLDGNIIAANPAGQQF